MILKIVPTTSDSRRELRTALRSTNFVCPACDVKADHSGISNTRPSRPGMGNRSKQEQRQLCLTTSRCASSSSSCIRLLGSSSDVSLDISHDFGQEPQDHYILVLLDTRVQPSAETWVSCLFSRCPSRQGGP